MGLEMQILDIDYILVNSRPVIRIFGKDVKGRSVVAFREGCLPYFYVLECDPEKVAREAGVLKVETVRKTVIGVGQRVIYKIIMNNPQLVPELREKLKSQGCEVYEADILFRTRFMADAGLAGMGWVMIADGNGVGTESVRADVKVQASVIEPVKRDEIAELRMLSFDIECVSESGNVPDAKKDRIVMIGVMLSHEHKGGKQFLYGLRRYEGVTSFGDEKEMLEEFASLIIEYDPDVITGFNVNGFDMPYLLERMEQNGIRPVFGRCAQKPAFAKRIGQRGVSYVPGRVVVDSYQIIKKDFSLQRYGLDHVSEKLLGQKKEDVKKSDIPKYFKGGGKEYEKLAAYCLQDAVLAMNLVVLLNLLDKYIALAKVSGTLLQETLYSGEAARIENYLLREFNKEGYVFPSRPEKPGEALFGGEVLEPAKGLHSSVAVLDFRSMYPSIIKSFNICPTTLTKDDENCIITPSGARFLKPEIRVGVIPRIVEELMQARQQTKAQLRKAKQKDIARMLHAKQWAYKTLANAFYGYFGYVNSKLFNLEIANAITAIGRKTIIDTKRSIEERFKLNVVYGDTDSVFVRIEGEEDFESIEAKANEIVEYANGILPKGVELEFEKIFKRFLPLTKKRYAAWSFVKTADGIWKEEIETKGIETVRRDWCPLVSKSIGEVLRIILVENDRKKALEYFKGITIKLLNGEIPLGELIVTKTMTKPVKSYEGMQPHIELVKKMQMRSRGEAPGIGDRIGFVIVKGTQLLSKRAEDPAYVMEHSLQIDSRYYIENQLLPPLERIFSVMGISKNELLRNGRQMGLFDAIAKSNEKVKVLESVPYSKVKGYTCEGCSEFYELPPLAGLCRCGGNLLFSSPDGLARFAIVES